MVKDILSISIYAAVITLIVVLGLAFVSLVALLAIPATLATLVFKLMESRDDSSK